VSHQAAWLHLLELGFEQYLNAHGHTDEESHSVAESSGWLWYCQLVDEGVKNTRASEHAEVPESRGRVRLNGDVEKTKEQERGDVLKVVQVISTDSLDFVR